MNAELKSYIFAEKEKSKRMPMYDAVRELMKPGDLIEFDSPGLIGWGIQKKTGMTVNHTGVVIDFPHLWPGLVFLIESLMSGPVPHMLSDRLLAFKGKAYWVQLKPQYDDYRNQIAAHCLEDASRDCGYDYAAIIKQLFWKPKKVGHRRLYCSELAFAACQDANLPMIPQKYVPYPGEFGKTGCFNQPVRIL